MRESTATPALVARWSISSSSGTAASDSRSGAGGVERQVVGNHRQVSGNKRRVLRAASRSVDSSVACESVEPRNGNRMRRPEAPRVAARGEAHAPPAGGQSRRRERSATIRTSTPGSLRISRSGSDSPKRRKPGARLRLADQHVGRAALGRHPGGGFHQVVALLHEQRRAEHRGQPAQRLELLALLARGGRPGGCT